jgi:hypothetical protein
MQVHTLRMSLEIDGDEAAARNAAGAALHPRDDSNPHGPWCPTCLTAWPCATYRALVPCPARTAEGEQRG